MTLAARLATRRRFDRLSRRQLEELVDDLVQQRAGLTEDLARAHRRAEHHLAALRDQQDRIEQRLLGRAFAHEADARHRNTGIDRAKWHQAVADELRDAARDIQQQHAPRNDGSH